MTRWVPFLGLTGVVLVLLLGLARLSSGVVRDGDGGGSPRPDPDRLGEPRRPDQSVDDRPTGPMATDGALGEPPVNRDAGPTASSPTEPPEAARYRDLTTGTLLANVALTQGLVGLALVAGLVWFDVPGEALGLTADPWIGGLPAVGLGVAFGVILWLGNEAATGFADAVGATYDEAVRGMLAPDSAVGWAILLGLVLPTVAVVEELLFRAALIGVPAAATGLSPWLLAIGSSVAFALGHGAQGPIGVVVTGVLGLVLAAGYVVSGSLVVVVVAHYLVNALEFVVHEGSGAEPAPAP